MLTTEWDGSGQDHDRTGVGGDWLDESEITLLPGTPLSVNSVTFGSSFGDGYEVLNTDKYDRYTESFTSQGLQPPKGGPQSRFARNEFSSRREAKGQNLYRGLSSDFLTEDEYSQISDWAMKNEFDPDNFTMAEPNYDMIYPILERLEEQQGLGRHWSTDYDVASGFASQGAWNNKGDEEGDGGHFGIVFRGDWGGEGEDSADSHAGYDGVTRPSRLEGEEEVTLHPGSEVNLLGMEVFKPGGFRYEIPVPDVPVYAMKRNSGTRDDPGAVYRGLSSDFLTDEEFDTIVNWEKNNGWDRDPDSFQMAEPNFEMIYPILERLEEKQGLGRHWSKDYDIAMEFAGGGITDNQYSEDYDENKEHFGIVFRGDWGGEGVDYAESHQGYDGVTRPSNHPHEEEVTLHPGSEVNLLGLDIISPDFDVYSIPTPDIPIYSNKISSHKKEGNMSAINRYLRFTRAKGLDPNGSEAPRLYRRASRGLSPASMVEISRWRGAQKTAHKTADKVLSNTRSYRRKMSSSSWYLDNNLSAYVSKVQQKFACSCGAKLAVPSYTNCKCGKVWNSYKIHSATKGDTMFVVREVPVRENVLVANNKTASRRPARRGYRR